ncbi:hypothetical protein [Novilysobacter antarcticus]|uniref:hypothetical protein n=1 Tax=Novilysobacter antarcticus TaxID=2862543 RepID=UPI001C99A7B5|nr:hypothetical protein [Lysobacter antarcticus]
MLLLPETRKAFLEHCRNLSGQVLILTLTIVLANITSFPSCALRDVALLVVVALMAWLYCYSVVANGMTFLENALQETMKAQTVQDAAADAELPRLTRMSIFLKTMWCHRKLIWKEALLGVLVVAAGGLISITLGLAYGVKVAKELIGG